MSVSRAFTLYAADVNGTMIDQVSSFGVDSGLEQFLLLADGGVDPTYSAVKGLVPKISFSTHAVAAALAVAGMNAASVTAASFFFQKLAEGGTRASGSSHLKLALTKGMIFPRSLSAGHAEPAELSYEVLCLTDGGGVPVTISKNQALTGSPVVDQLYVAGPVKINGTLLAGVQSIKIDFGIKEVVLGGDGEVYPSFAAIMTRAPKITIELLDLDILADLTIAGAAQGATDTVIYLRKVEAGGTRVADATAEHISFSIDAGHIGIGNSGAKPGGPATVSLEITPIFDGTNDILAINTAAAIA